MTFLGLSTKVVAAGAACAFTLGAFAQLPNTMGVLGDSISRATLADDNIGGLDFGQPQHSWATGDDSGDGLSSHYENILASNPAIAGNNNNFAESGSRMDDMPGQAMDAVNAGVEYVTMQIGGNDLCRDEASQMTSTASFEADFRLTLDILQTGLPDATILITETVRPVTLYEVGRRDFWCQIKWWVFGFCDSALRNGSSQRAQVDARNIEYNNILRSVCAQEGVPFADTVYETPFRKTDVSNVDCFHPAISGQDLLSDRTYDQSIFD